MVRPVLGNPILNEKIYKIEYNDPKNVIDNLEPEIEKIKKAKDELNSKNTIMNRNYENLMILDCFVFISHSQLSVLIYLKCSVENIDF